MAENRWNDEQRGRFDDDYQRERNFGQRGYYREEYEGNRGTQRFDRDDDDAGYGGRYDDRGHPSRYRTDDRADRYGMRGQGRPRGDDERGWWDRTTDEVASWMGDDDARRRREVDKGEHRGKGPKGYTRSDDRIREDVSDRLSDESWLDASEIEVSVDKGEVTLNGTVDSRDDKRRAEDIAEEVSGVRHVQNNLRLHTSGPSEARGRASKAKSAPT